MQKHLLAKSTGQMILLGTAVISTGIITSYNPITALAEEMEGNVLKAEDNPIHTDDDIHTLETNLKEVQKNDEVIAQLEKNAETSLNESQEKIEVAQAGVDQETTAVEEAEKAFESEKEHLVEQAQTEVEEATQSEAEAKQHYHEAKEQADIAQKGLEEIKETFEERKQQIQAIIDEHPKLNEEWNAAKEKVEAETPTPEPPEKAELEEIQVKLTESKKALTQLEAKQSKLQTAYEEAKKTTSEAEAAKGKLEEKLQQLQQQLQQLEEHSENYEKAQKELESHKTKLQSVEVEIEEAKRHQENLDQNLQNHKKELEVYKEKIKQLEALQSEVQTKEQQVTQQEEKIHTQTAKVEATETEKQEAEQLLVKEQEALKVKQQELENAQKLGKEQAGNNEQLIAEAQKKVNLAQAEVERLAKIVQEASTEENKQKAQEQWNKGSVGFFEEMKSEKALDVFKSNKNDLMSNKRKVRVNLGNVPVTETEEDYQKRVANYLAATANAGQDDARSLDRMKEAIQAIVEINQKRQKEMGIDGRPLSPLKITDFAMAVAQANANYYAAYNEEAEVYLPTESIHKGTTSASAALALWWDKEKKVFDYLRKDQRLPSYIPMEEYAKNNAYKLIEDFGTNRFADYLNLVDAKDWGTVQTSSDNQIIGYGVRPSTVQARAVNSIRNIHSVNLDKQIVGEAHAIEDYQVRFENYYNDVKRGIEGKPLLEVEINYEIAQQDLKRAQDELKQLKEGSSESDQTQIQLQNEIKAQSEKIEEIKASIQQKETEIIKEKQALEAAKEALTQAQEQVKQAEQKVEEFKQANSDLENKVQPIQTAIEQTQQELDQAKQLISEKETLKSQTETAIKETEAKLAEFDKNKETNLQDAIAKVQKDLEEAKVALQMAEDKEAEAVQQLEAKKQSVQEKHEEVTKLEQQEKEKLSILEKVQEALTEDQKNFDRLDKIKKQLESLKHQLNFEENDLNDRQFEVAQANKRVKEAQEILAEKDLELQHAQNKLNVLKAIDLNNVDSYHNHPKLLELATALEQAKQSLAKANEYLQEVVKQRDIRQHAYEQVRQTRQISLDKIAEITKALMAQITFDYAHDMTQPQTLTLKLGDKVILEAPQREGYVFLNWGSPLYTPGHELTLRYRKQTLTAMWGMIVPFKSTVEVTTDKLLHDTVKVEGKNGIVDSYGQSIQEVVDEVKYVYTEIITTELPYDTQFILTNDQTLDGQVMTPGRTGTRTVRHTIDQMETLEEILPITKEVYQYVAPKVSTKTVVLPFVQLIVVTDNKELDGTVKVQGQEGTKEILTTTYLDGSQKVEEKIIKEPVHEEVYQYVQEMVDATIEIDLAGGTLDGQTGSIIIHAHVGDTIYLPDAPTREGYEFLYWQGSRYNPGEAYLIVDPNHTFTAIWKQIEKMEEPNKEPNNEEIIPMPEKPREEGPKVPEDSMDKIPEKPREEGPKAPEDSMDKTPEKPRDDEKSKDPNGSVEKSLEASHSSETTVTKATVETQLPETGETHLFSILSAAILSFLMGLGLIRRTSSDTSENKSI